MSLRIAAEVRRALSEGAAVVALESSLICHGFPRPANLEVAQGMAAAVRESGAVPAITAVLGGAVRIGLGEPELRRLAEAPAVMKCGARELPLALACGTPGATTVAGTAFLAARAGIGVMATGGIGGVHRGGEQSMDVSADLEQLARSPVAVVCSGAKSILDLGRTLERLETLGVLVVGFGCDEFPGFYTAGTGIAVPRVDDLDGLCGIIRAQRALGVPGGVVVAQPPPAAYALERPEVDQLVAEARAAAARAGIRGAAETPFLLRQVAGASGGRTVRLNHELVLANARLAGRLARALAGGAAAGESA